MYQLKEKTWIDEKGSRIPVSSVKKSEKVLERITEVIVKDAVKINTAISVFKDKVRTLAEQAINAIMLDYTGSKKEFKGNYTLYNFDRSIKVVVKVTAAIKFDDITISLAKEKMREFLNSGISSKSQIVKEMVMDAFETRNGQLDVDKVLSLRRYRDRVNDEIFHEALTLVDKAIRRPETSTYYQVWVRNCEGKYESICLDFSKI